MPYPARVPTLSRRTAGRSQSICCSLSRRLAWTVGADRSWWTVGAPPLWSQEYDPCLTTVDLVHHDPQHMCAGRLKRPERFLELRAVEFGRRRRRQVRHPPSSRELPRRSQAAKVGCLARPCRTKPSADQEGWPSQLSRGVRRWDSGGSGQTAGDQGWSFPEAEPRPPRRSARPISTVVKPTLPSMPDVFSHRRPTQVGVDKNDPRARICQRNSEVEGDGRLALGGHRGADHNRPRPIPHVDELKVEVRSRRTASDGAANGSSLPSMTRMAQEPLDRRRPHQGWGCRSTHAHPARCEPWYRAVCGGPQCRTPRVAQG